ncbi:MAG: hypothetical protein ABII93_02550 [Chrysiogenia bacterium]
MKKALIYPVLFITLLFWAANGISAGSDFIDVSGYYKFFFTGFKTPVYRLGTEEVREPPVGAVNNRLRLKLSSQPCRWLSFEAAYDFSPRIQDPLLFQDDIFFSAPDPGTYRVGDLPGRLYPGRAKTTGSFGIFHNLDRCFFTIKTAGADIFVGRQAIAWGSGRFINPTDVIAPFAFNELDSEERRGVDAVRVRIPLGMMNELDLGYIPGKEFKFKNSAFYLRGKAYLWKTDIALLLMGFRENLLIGLDFTRAVGGAGVWLETALVDAGLFCTDNEPLDGNENDGQTYLRASLGVDYNFNGRFYGFCEYHFNSAGKKKPAEYGKVFSSTAFTEGASYLMGQHYLNLGMTCQLTPLIPFTGVAFVNLDDGSLTLAPALEYNIAENIYLGGGAYIGLGKRPEKTAPSAAKSSTIFHSEFGAYPAMLYTSLRIYF